MRNHQSYQHIDIRVYVTVGGAFCRGTLCHGSSNTFVGLFPAVLRTQSIQHRSPPSPHLRITAPYTCTSTRELLRVWWPHNLTLFTTSRRVRAMISRVRRNSRNQATNPRSGFCEDGRPYRMGGMSRRATLPSGGRWAGWWLCRVAIAIMTIVWVCGGCRAEFAEQTSVSMFPTRCRRPVSHKHPMRKNTAREWRTSSWPQWNEGRKGGSRYLERRLAGPGVWNWHQEHDDITDDEFANNATHWYEWVLPLCSKWNSYWNFCVNKL